MVQDTEAQISPNGCAIGVFMGVLSIVMSILDRKHCIAPNEQLSPCGECDKC